MVTIIFETTYIFPSRIREITLVVICIQYITSGARFALSCIEIDVDTVLSIIYASTGSVFEFVIVFAIRAFALFIVRFAFRYFFDALVFWIASDELIIVITFPTFTIVIIISAVRILYVALLIIFI